MTKGLIIAIVAVLAVAVIVASAFLIIRAKAAAPGAHPEDDGR